ncbi:hypothetical protein [Coprobacter tertius]|uniref:Uncharacterized protein n=1 Tax=Coprobacter tertius TaxID=2944915 RepID=A0ABT1MD39_9BACT|nr:hypothetical protein [Coprobacter tertius]MCP9610558.1 hypothetical protein [Coprobacter tertius]
MKRSKMILAVKIAMALAVVLYIAFWGYNKIKFMSLKKYKWEPTSNVPILFPVDIHVAYMRCGENSALAVVVPTTQVWGILVRHMVWKGRFRFPPDWM